MKNFRKLLFWFLYIGKLFTQDESVIDKILASKNEEILQNNASFVFGGPLIKLDINGDKVLEHIQFQIRDGSAYLMVYEDDLTTLFSEELGVMGGDAKLFKIRLHSLSPSENMLLLYFYEGYRYFSEFKAQSRIYILNFNKFTLKDFSLFKGPYISSEVKDFLDHYHIKRFKVNVHDFNNDNVYEIQMIDNQISRILFYTGNGRWVSL